MGEAEMDRQSRMDALKLDIKACRDCEGLNKRKVTESAPGFGSIDSPVAIVGQSLCQKCMDSGVPFTGGSGRYIDKALEDAGRNKRELFITNVVHCHPPDDRKSKRHEIDNCRHFLQDELAIVQPVLAIGLGDDAEAELRAYYDNAQELPWPFIKPRRFKPNTTYVLFPEHPGSLRFKKTPDRAYYSPSLGSAIRWGFDVRN
jgi:uracil-DNA glycosylase family 4